MAPTFLRPVALLSLALCVLSTPTPDNNKSTDDEAHIVHDVVARGSCKDNLGRCFNPTGSKPTDIASRSAAAAFCSSFLSVPVVTSVIGTHTPATVVTITATVVASTEVQTSVAESDVQATETSQTTVTTTLSTRPVAIRRDVSSAGLPKCATGAAHSPEEFSSACSCVSVTPFTTYLTATADIATSTALDTVSITTTTVTIQTSTVTTGTTTVVETAVATVTSSPPAASCADVVNPYIVNGESFTAVCDQYYYDFGHELARTDGVTAFSDCIAFCANTPGCLYAYWVSPTAYYSDKLFCYAFDEFTPGALGDAPGVDSVSLNV